MLRNTKDETISWLLNLEELSEFLCEIMWS